MAKENKEISKEALVSSDGAQDAPAYVAVKGRVIDVSESKLWRGGIHMKRHRAGQDLTLALKDAPHGEEVLDRYPQVGTLIDGATPEAEKPENQFSRLLQRFPFLKRHPHPMTVHFPIAFAMMAPLFLILSILFGYAPLEETAWHLLGAGVLFTPVAMVTGIYIWWLNYMKQVFRQVRYKLLLSPLLFLLFLGGFLWRHYQPELMQSWTTGIGYFLLLALLALVASLIGWFGALLTFPVERD